MRIAILGTRGIPNNYGGFEQFAEYLSAGLVHKGHEVTVYNPHFHPFSKNEFNGVNIIKIYSPEAFLGGFANFIYDFLCLRDAYNRDYDIVYELGYGSSAISYFLLHLKKKKSILITNMDGLEWKRQKWNFIVKWLTKESEKIAIRFSDIIVADNIGIQNHYRKIHNKESIFLPYGAELVEQFDSSYLSRYQVKANEYFLLIARLEPENNIEVIIKGYLLSSTIEPLVIIGNFENKYGEYLIKNYRIAKVIFLGGIYEKDVIDSLRHFSKAYFHGHSVGGTNPSLLEAMSCGCFIVAHRNEFNQSVLENNGIYFSEEIELSKIFIQMNELLLDFLNMTRRNQEKIKRFYDWQKIIADHEIFFETCIRNRQTA